MQFYWSLVICVDRCSVVHTSLLKGSWCFFAFGYSSNVSCVLRLPSMKLCRRWVLAMPGPPLCPGSLGALIGKAWIYVPDFLSCMKNLIQRPVKWLRSAILVSMQLQFLVTSAKIYTTFFFPLNLCLEKLNSDPNIVTESSVLLGVHQRHDLSLYGTTLTY